MAALQRLYLAASPVPIVLVLAAEVIARRWHGDGPSGGLEFLIYAFYASLTLMVVGVALMIASKFKRRRVWPLALATLVAATPFVYLFAGMLCGAA